MVQTKLNFLSDQTLSYILKMMTNIVLFGQ